MVKDSDILSMMEGMLLSSDWGDSSIISCEASLTPDKKKLRISFFNNDCTTDEFDIHCERIN